VSDRQAPQRIPGEHDEVRPVFSDRLHDGAMARSFAANVAVHRDPHRFILPPHRDRRRGSPGIWIDPPRIGPDVLERPAACGRATDERHRDAALDASAAMHHDFPVMASMLVRNTQSRKVPQYGIRVWAACETDAL
jgi:hypothetical protein